MRHNFRRRVLFADQGRKLRNKAGLSADNSAFFVLEMMTLKKSLKKCKKMLT